MTGGRGQSTHGILQYPGTARIKPEDFLGFMEAPGFYDDCKAIGINDDDVMCIQFGIMINPKHGRAIRRAGGLRRLVCKNRNTGQVIRVFYAYFEFCSTVIFYGVEPDDVAENFTDEIRDEFRLSIAWESRALSVKSYRAKNQEDSHDDTRP